LSTSFSRVFPLLLFLNRSTTRSALILLRAGPTCSKTAPRGSTCTPTAPPTPTTTGPRAAVPTCSASTTPARATLLAPQLFRPVSWTRRAKRAPTARMGAAGAFRRRVPPPSQHAQQTKMPFALECGTAVFLKQMLHFSRTPTAASIFTNHSSDYRAVSKRGLLRKFFYFISPIHCYGGTTTTKTGIFYKFREQLITFRYYLK
jgi:hypothetical protein